MPAGTLTGANTLSVWTDIGKLSPMVWLQAAMVEQNLVQPVMDLFDVDQLDQFNRDYGNIEESGFGVVTQEGADYTTRVNNQGDTLSVTVVKRTDAKTVTEDLVDGSKYRDIYFKISDLGSSLFRTRARDSTHHFFTFGFSTSYTDAQGNTVTNGVANASTEAIFADTHTMATGATYDNNLADTALGEVSLRNLEDLTTGFLDENGIRVPWGISAEKILCTSNDTPIRHVAKRLTEQPWQIDSGNRNMNIYPGEYRHVILWYLNTTASGAVDSTKDKYYYILDSKLAKRYAIFADHTKPTMSGPFDDMWNGGMLWRAKTRYEKGCQKALIGAGSPATT